MEYIKTRRHSNPTILPQELINSLALEFKEKEWQWLNNLPPSYTQTLVQEGETFDPSLFTHYGEFFLTLSGIKPCLLIPSHGHPTFAEDLCNVISTLLDRLPGFGLYRCHRSPNHDSTCNQMVYVFTSRDHPKFHLIKELILQPPPGPVPPELFCKALGYPAPGGESSFCYVDVTTTQELGVGCVTVFEFTAREGFDLTIKMHFEKCAAEFRKLGKVLTILSN